MKYWIVWLISIMAVPAFYSFAYRTQNNVLTIVFELLASLALAFVSVSYRLIYRDRDYERGFHAGYNAGRCAEEVEK